MSYMLDLEQEIRDDTRSSIQSIQKLLQKIEDQTEQEFERINIKNSFDRSSAYSDKITNIIWQANVLYQLCIHQLSQKLVEHKLEEISVQFQRIFNGINQQINFIVSYQINLLKKKLDSQQLQQNAEKIMYKQFQIKFNIPPQARSISYKLQHDSDQYEMTKQEALKEIQKQKQEIDKITEFSRTRIMKSQIQLDKIQSSNLKNINYIEGNLRPNKNLNYSGANKIFNKVLHNQQNFDRDSLNLESFKEINEDEEDDNIHLKEKKNKQKRRLTLNTLQIANQLQNQNLQEEINQLKEEIEKKDEQIQQYKTSFLNLKQVTLVLVQKFEECYCKFFTPNELAELKSEIENMTEFGNFKFTQLQKRISQRTSKTRFSSFQKVVKDQVIHKDDQDPNQKNDKSKQKKNIKFIKAEGAVQNQPPAAHSSKKSTKSTKQKANDNDKSTTKTLDPLEQLLQLEQNKTEQQIEQQAQLQNAVYNITNQKKSEFSKPLLKNRLSQIDKDTNKLNNQPEYQIQKNGQNIQVSKNAKGEFYYINPQGQQIIVDKSELINKVDNKNSNNQQEIKINYDGEGKAFILDEKGNKQLISKQQVEQYQNQNQLIKKQQNTAKNIQQMNDIIKQKTEVMINGKKVLIEKNEQGQIFYLDEQGNQKQIDQSQIILNQDSNGNFVLEQAQDIENFVIFDQNGEVIAEVYDQNGNILKNPQPFQQVFDKNGNQINQYQQEQIIDLSSAFDKNGNQILFFDQQGNIVKNVQEGQDIFDKDGNKIQLDQQIIYDQSGNSIKKSEMIKTQFVQQKFYDENGVEVTKRNSKQQLYDKQGKPIQMNNIKIQNQIVYDKQGNIIQNPKPNQQVYDQYGNKQENPYQNQQIQGFENNNKQKQIFYDKQGNQILNPTNNQELFDKNGNIVENQCQNYDKYMNQINQRLNQTENLNNNDKSFSQDNIIEEEEKPEYLTKDGKCKYCGSILQKNMSEVQVDENGKRYIVDQFGNILYIQMGENGKMGYYDIHGNFIDLHDQFMKRISKFGGPLEIKKAEKVKYEENIKQYDAVYRKLDNDESEIYDKIKLFDKDIQEKIHDQFQSENIDKLIDQSQLDDIQNSDIMNIYDSLRNIGANYKMSENEFIAKFKTFLKQHIHCEKEHCRKHLDFFYKKIIFQSHVNKLPKNKANQFRSLNIQKLNKNGKKIISQTPEK